MKTNNTLKHAGDALVEAKRRHVLELDQIQARVNELQGIVNAAEKTFVDAVMSETKKTKPAAPAS